MTHTSREYMGIENEGLGWLTQCGCTCWCLRLLTSPAQSQSHTAWVLEASHLSAVCCPASDPCRRQQVQIQRLQCLVTIQIHSGRKAVHRNLVWEFPHKVVIKRICEHIFRPPCLITIRDHNLSHTCETPLHKSSLATSCTANIYSLHEVTSSRHQKSWIVGQSEWL